MMDLKIVKDLMDKLKDEMQYGKDDLSHRLGRDKPEIKVTKIVSAVPDDGDDDADEDMSDMGDAKTQFDAQGEMESKKAMDPSLDDEDIASDDDEMSPMSLKQRLMKLRG